MCGWCERFQGRHIATVHAQYEVVSPKIRLSDLPAALPADIDAVFAGHGDRARVGRFAGMPSTGSSRSNHQRTCVALFIREMAQDSLSKR